MEGRFLPFALAPMLAAASFASHASDFVPPSDDYNARITLEHVVVGGNSFVAQLEAISSRESIHPGQIYQITYLMEADTSIVSAIDARFASDDGLLVVPHLEESNLLSHDVTFLLTQDNPIQLTVIRLESQFDNPATDTSLSSGGVGPQGPRGSAGPRGLTGDTGPAGADGADGIDGIDGATGPQGPAGAQGPAGVAGATGRQGIQGLPGTQGLQGLQGIPGPAGAGAKAIIPFASGEPGVLTTVVGGLAGTGTVLGFGHSRPGIQAIAGGVDTTSTPSFAFTMPYDGAITDISAFMSTKVAMNLLGTTVSVHAKIYTSTGGNHFVELPGVQTTLWPDLTGIVGIGAVGSGLITGLNIPLTAGTRVMLIFEATATGLTLINTVTADLSGSIAITSP